MLMERENEVLLYCANFNFLFLFQQGPGNSFEQNYLFFLSSISHKIQKPETMTKVYLFCCIELKEAIKSLNEDALNKTKEALAESETELEGNKELQSISIKENLFYNQPLSIPSLKVYKILFWVLISF